MAGRKKQSTEVVGIPTHCPHCENAIVLSVKLSKPRKARQQQLDVDVSEKSDSSVSESDPVVAEKVEEEPEQVEEEPEQVEEEPEQVEEEEEEAPRPLPPLPLKRRRTIKTPGRRTGGKIKRV